MSFWLAKHYGRIRKHLITVWGIGKRHTLPSEFDRYRNAFRRAGLDTDDSFKALPVNKEAAKDPFKRKKMEQLGPQRTRVHRPPDAEPLGQKAQHFRRSALR